MGLMDFLSPQPSNDGHKRSTPFATIEGFFKAFGRGSVNRAPSNSLPRSWTRSTFRFCILTSQRPGNLYASFRADLHRHKTSHLPEPGRLAVESGADPVQPSNWL